jgi:hypothetical protein
MERAPFEENARASRRRARPGPLTVGVALLAAAGLSACVAPGPRRVSSPSPAVADETRVAIDDAVRLYESQEYAMAARRFADGAALADRMGDPALEWRAVAAECTSWLLARMLDELDACGLRLDAVQRRTHETSSGTNALIALGAVAGGRAQPAVNVPRAVRSVVRPGSEDY